MMGAYGHHLKDLSGEASSFFNDILAQREGSGEL